MNLTKSDWYFIILVLIIIALLGINEWGYGVIALFLLPLAYWLMSQAFGEEQPK